MLRQQKSMRVITYHLTDSEACLAVNFGDLFWYVFFLGVMPSPPQGAPGFQHSTGLGICVKCVDTNHGFSWSFDKPLYQSFWLNVSHCDIYQNRNNFHLICASKEQTDNISKTHLFVMYTVLWMLFLAVCVFLQPFWVLYEWVSNESIWRTFLDLWFCATCGWCISERVQDSRHDRNKLSTPSTFVSCF